MQDDLIKDESLLHVISLGAGVQSSTMALMAAHGEIKPMPACAIFADTQAEPKSVYTWLDWLEKQLPFPVVKVTKGNLADALRAVVSKSGFSYIARTIPAFKKKPDGSVSMMMRNCTRDFKVKPVAKKVREILRQTGREKCILWIGISTDEIFRIKPSRFNNTEHVFPLIERNLSRMNCIRYLRKIAPIEPVKSSCVFCPFRNFRLNTKAEMEEAIRVEIQFQAECFKVPKVGGIPFLHRSCVPLSEVDFSTEEERGQLDMFNNECEGMCGV